MIIDEKTYNRMPKKLQYMFNKLPNPGSDEVLAEFAKAGERKSGGSSGKRKSGPYSNERTWSVSTTPGADVKGGLPPDTGTAARFFYCAKASRAERNAGLPEGETSIHPTVKPLALMRYLARLTRTPTGGVILDPFLGSGTTGMAAVMEGRPFIGIELDEQYYAIAQARIADAQRQPPLFV